MSWCNHRQSCSSNLYFLLLPMLLICGCAGADGNPEGTRIQPINISTLPQVTASPFQPQNSSITPQDYIFTEQATNLPSNSIWISASVPAGLRNAVLVSGLQPTSEIASASVWLDVVQQPDRDTSSWIYAAVAPFPTIPDSLSFLDIRSAWNGNATGPFAGASFWMDEATITAFSTAWAAPGPGAVHVATDGKLVESVWADSPAWAIVPFEALEPRWKVLSVDGQSPIQREFNPAIYPLKLDFGLSYPIFTLPSTNRDPGRLTMVAMTGTTALVRAIADRMNRKGILYPGEKIREVLRSADILHISNEISFYGECPIPDPWTFSLQFCSDPSYIKLLEDVGVDVIEMTGNHVKDYGSQPLLDTIEMYDQRSWAYFGGGRNLWDARQPAIVEHNGNKLAFIGCNIPGPENAWATEDDPGALPCDLSQMQTQIQNLHSRGYLPIMTFQYYEYEQNFPTDYEQRDFRKMADAGAVIVSGSQAHEPASMEFRQQTFIHFGLGNLFFDQMFPNSRREFVDRHVFYNGRYISTELLTYLLEDSSQPRPMLSDERSGFLDDIFSASGW